jgi:hypothetical protein
MRVGLLMDNFLAELKRRSIFRVGAAYPQRSNEGQGAGSSARIG